jgi:pilus assembly protein CpaB
MQIQRIQRLLPLIIAIACGIWAILLLNSYLKRREDEIWLRIKKVQLQAPPPQAVQQMGIALVAGKDIPPQVPITPADLLIKEIPVQYIQPGSITSLGEITGQISNSPIAAGEQILKTKLMPAGKVGKSLAEVTPAGKRAITISVDKDNMASLASFLHPGNRVDVFALVNMPEYVDPSARKGTTSRLIPLFQAVEVIAVGNDFVASDQPKAAGGATGTITLALSPQESVLLSFVQEHGKIKLDLRSSDDNNKEAIKPADWDALLRYLYPDRDFNAEEKKSGPGVEVYRGLNKEIVPMREKGK